MNDHDCNNFRQFDPVVLERTPEAQRGFAGMTTHIMVVDGADGLTPDMLRTKKDNAT